MVTECEVVGLAIHPHGADYDNYICLVLEVDYTLHALPSSLCLPVCGHTSTLMVTECEVVGLAIHPHGADYNNYICYTIMNLI